MNQLKAQDFHILIVEDDKEIRDGIEICSRHVLFFLKLS